jgi:hypothetical protein
MGCVEVAKICRSGKKHGSDKMGMVEVVLSLVGLLRPECSVVALMIAMVKIDIPCLPFSHMMSFLSSFLKITD